MDRTALKNYAPKARREFIQAVTDRAAFYGLTAKVIEPVTEKGDIVIIDGRAFPAMVASQRRSLECRIARQGFDQVMEATAYTWFNRFVALRYMELHGYLDHGYGVLSHPEGTATPEIVEQAEHVVLPGLDRQKVIELKLDGTKETELYRLLLVAQCNALNEAMPFLFERIDDETELLLPDNLLHSDSVIRKLVNEIEEEDWKEVEIIGWIYQFYISEKKDQVIGKVVKSEDIPAATQLFTPNWIVKYLVQNTLGRQWLATYPDSPLRHRMEYYIEPAEQTEEVKAQLRAITPRSLNPEELTLLDPACGSGHILVEAYDLFKAIYQERGYRSGDIPKIILQKNLYGLEIDDRAAQLAAFALMMKARADDRSIFDSEAKPNILAFEESHKINAAAITHTLNLSIPSLGEGRVSQGDIASLLALFENAKTFGSLIQIPPMLAAKVPEIEKRLNDVLKHGDLTHSAAHVIKPLLQQARVLARQYDAVVANPPYMGSNGINPLLRDFLVGVYPDLKSDLFAAFGGRLVVFANAGSRVGVVTPFTWMNLTTYAALRRLFIYDNALTSLIRPEYHSFFDSAYVPLCAFVIIRANTDYVATFIDLNSFYGEDEQPRRALEAITNPNCAWRFHRPIHYFHKTPGMVLAYSLDESALQMFEKLPRLSDYADLRQGLITGDNNQFLRFWHEIDISRSSINRSDRSRKWFPYQKGGSFRKWYGNNEYVVNWHNDGQEIRNLRTPSGKQKSRPQNVSYYFQEGLTWTSLTISKLSMRYVPSGFIFDAKGPMLFPKDHTRLYDVLGYANSNLINVFLKELAPTMDFSQGPVGSVPYPPDLRVADLVEHLIRVAKDDWDLLEESWDFSEMPLIRNDFSNESIARSWQLFNDAQKLLVDGTAKTEEKINQTVRENCLLEDYADGVELDQITLYRPDREEDIKRLLSYAIGCVMGRYSLDKPGLIHAHSRNAGFDPSQYKTFPADTDGIVPLIELGWFLNDAAERVAEFIGKAWPKEHLEENLKFIAESIGAKKGEQPRETIRRYLSQSFFRDHLQTYKKRPIYWLFSSGKERAFQCLVYLHRYHEGTLARMRTEYVIPLQGKVAARIEQLACDILKATSTSHRKKLEKEQDTLKKQQLELQAFDEKLRHFADQRITLDLDDGVKVNYGKFGDLLAEVTAVCGKSEDEE